MLTLSNGGTFEFAGSNQTVGGLVGGSSTLMLDGILAVNMASDTTFTGQITGAGGILKQGSGKLRLTGNASYTGGITVAGGTLEGNTSSLKGNFVNNAAVVFDQSAVGSYAGNMSGTGTVIRRWSACRNHPHR